MIEKARKILHKGQTFGTFWTDLSKAFSCMTHSPLIVKLLNWTLIWVRSTWYLIIWQEGNKESNLTPVLTHIWIYFKSVLQGSILGLILFNLFLCDLFLFFEEADIMSYTDDNTLYVCSENVDVTLEKQEEVGKVLFEWFSNNFLKANADKCHLILSRIDPFQLI